MFHWGWEKLDAKVIDEKFVERTTANVKRGIHYQVWDYMVEVPGLDRAPKRLVIREKTYKLILPLPETVPVLVNKRRTKAAFDLDDPRIDGVGQLKRKEEARRKRDEERFRRELGE